MLDTLRKNSKSALIYVFFGIIIIVFVFSFGPASNGCRSGSFASGGSVAARVNGREITRADFEQSYGRIFRDYQARAGGAFNEQLAQSIGLKEKVLDQLIDQELLAQAALDTGITVTDAELNEAIRKVPAFQVEGAFDPEQYQLIVERQLGTRPAQFEEEMRRSMLAQKMLASLSGSAKVSDDEVKAEYAREKEKLELSFVRFSPSAFKAEVAKPTDAQVDELLSKEMPRVEEYYKNNSFRYNKPKRVQARHILIKLDKDATDEQVAAATKKLDETKQKLAGGADFATLAKEMSEDPGSKDKGGDLGIFGPGMMDPAFEAAAFALASGEVSTPVRTSFGVHLIKVDQVLPEEKRTLDEAKREIASELLVDDGAKALAKQKAEEALAQAKGGKSLEEIVPAPAPAPTGEEQQALRMEVGGAPKVETTGAYSPTGDYIPRIGVDAGLAGDAIALGENKPADKVYEINGNYYVVALKAHQRADMSELAAKMDEYREKARDRKSGEVVESYIESLKAKSKIDKNQELLGPSTSDELAMGNG